MSNANSPSNPWGDCCGIADRVTFRPLGFRDVMWCPYLNEPAILEWRDNKPHCPNCEGNFEPQTHPFICNIQKVSPLRTSYTVACSSGKRDISSNESVCTCHPTDRPPICQHRYGARECQDAYRVYNVENRNLRAALAAANAEIGRLRQPAADWERFAESVREAKRRTDKRFVPRALAKGDRVIYTPLYDSKLPREDWTVEELPKLTYVINHPNGSVIVVDAAEIVAVEPTADLLSIARQVSTMNDRTSKTDLITQWRNLRDKVLRGDEEQETLGEILETGDLLVRALNADETRATASNKQFDVETWFNELCPNCERLIGDCPTALREKIRSLLPSRYNREIDKLTECGKFIASDEYCELLIGHEGRCGLKPGSVRHAVQPQAGLLTASDEGER